MKQFAVFVLVILCSGLTGCFASDSDDEFEWPEPTEFNCELSQDYELECKLYMEGFETPHHSILNPENGELWIIYLNGFVKSWNGEELGEVVDLSSLVNRCHMEQGLLGMAFDEDFNTSKTVLISYIEEGSCDGPNESDLILASIVAGENGLLDPSTVSTLRTIEQPYRNHNGGHLISIGNNQYLWGIGDGGDANDPENNGQNEANSLGSINLFSYKNGEISPVLNSSENDPYVLHHGLRNPWRFSLGENNTIWIGDVGQNCWEEINLVPLYERKNLGWSIKEGLQDFEEGGECYENSNQDEDGLTYPVLVYGHENGNCSITGGFWMDWGPESLQNGYLYGDFCSGEIWLLKQTVDGEWKENYVGSSGGMIVGFGRGIAEELLVFHWTGDIALIE